jgi:hypothetical protein
MLAIFLTKLRKILPLPILKSKYPFHIYFQVKIYKFIPIKKETKRMLVIFLNTCPFEFTFKLKVPIRFYKK